ncbi:FAD/NAD(P)-binding domain-containing protein [Punctularia strigosozonata HHB-11173 SS5]|uniref:FAD/NAD(P)-binding domain-containing protein n=1 Tax=Punctularia strigosozonata (strain HHB-11173) TaxID=741275 RepID=UPI0004417B6E|nr:FAD/NAD(P)-binding domain-containing protein [Punctularia strigosozonata HHB-11173 SS5]EIN10427.1 FAD/NAD(P)-binding domain-containing protein [Punctularia strigosozonata HHB-11173 SS5]
MPFDFSFAPDTRRDQHVLIIGAGLVGLTIAQGLKHRGIRATVFERDTDGGRSQGWGLTIHWGLKALEHLLPSELFDQLDTCQVDPSLRANEGGYLFLDGRDGSPIISMPSGKRRIRANRQRLRELLLTGIDVKHGKRFNNFEVTSDGVRAYFVDGTCAEGTLLVGADGNNSVVRKQLLGEEAAALKPIPVVACGVVQRYTKEQVAPLRALDPLRFQAVNPDTGTYIWVRIQDVSPDRSRFDILTIVSHRVTDLSLELPRDATNVAKINDMKKRADGFAEPFYSLLNDIDPALNCTRLNLADWVPVPWTNMGAITLAGDAAGAMSMYRGEGVNHGMLDAVCLVMHLTRVSRCETVLGDALIEYEDEMRSRRQVAVPLSRQAALDAHSIPHADSPLCSRRAAPAICSRVFS